MMTMMSAWNPNAARQLNAAVIHPPISGPVAAPIPPAALTMPNARARSAIPVQYMVTRM